MRLLICIAHYFNLERFEYLKQVVQTILNQYDADFNIIIDTNSFDGVLKIENHFNCCSKIKAVANNSLPHPYHLTWCHRAHMRKNINNYDYFFYLEDDMKVTWENFSTYVNNFKLLWPKYVPGFLRVETKNDTGEVYSTDLTAQIIAEKDKLIAIDNKVFVDVSDLYSAVWALPRDSLKDAFRTGAALIKKGHFRENAASLPSRRMKKPVALELDVTTKASPLIFKNCLIHHLPNTYTNNIMSKYGNVKLADALVVK